MDLTVSRKSYARFAIAFFVLVVVGLGGYMTWQQFFSAEARNAKNIEAYQAYVKRGEDAMRADTYGGKTPQETLNLFIDALKKGDIDLASKYFALETNEKDPNYLTRKKWEDALKIAKDENRISEVVSLLERAEPDLKSANPQSGTAWFIVEENGEIKVDIELTFNEYSGVWKIESL